MSAGTTSRRGWWWRRSPGTALVEAERSRNRSRCERFRHAATVRASREATSGQHAVQASGALVDTVGINTLAIITPVGGTIDVGLGS